MRPEDRSAGGPTKLGASLNELQTTPALNGVKCSLAASSAAAAALEHLQLLVFGARLIDDKLASSVIAQFRRQFADQHRPRPRPSVPHRAASGQRASLVDQALLKAAKLAPTTFASRSPPCWPSCCFNSLQPNKPAACLSLARQQMLVSAHSRPPACPC